MNNKCYLIGYINKKTMVLEQVATASEDAGSITAEHGKYMLVNIHETWGGSYHEALNEMSRQLKRGTLFWGALVKRFPHIVESADDQVKKANEILSRAVEQEYSLYGDYRDYSGDPPTGE